MPTSPAESAGPIYCFNTPLILAVPRGILCWFAQIKNGHSWFVHTVLMEIKRPERTRSSKSGESMTTYSMNHNRLLFRRRTSPIKHLRPLCICLITMAFGMFISDEVDQALANMPPQPDASNTIRSQPATTPCPECKPSTLGMDFNRFSQD